MGRLSSNRNRAGCRVNIIQVVIILALLLGSLAIATYFAARWTQNHAQAFASELGRTATSLETIHKTPATSFLNAQQHLAVARIELETLRPVVEPVLFLAEWFTDLPWIGPPTQQVINLWLFADAVTQLGESLLNAAELGLAGLEEEGTAGLIAAMPTLHSHLQTAEVNFAQAQAARTRLDVNSAWWLPDDQAEKLDSMLSRWDEISPDFGKLLVEANRLASVITVMLGSDKPTTYLLLLQSSDELRATGGFINSVGTIRIEEGEITELTLTEVKEAEVPIDADWSDGSREIHIRSAPDTSPPPPLMLYMGLRYWVLRDANWWADFPTTARQAVALWKDGQAVPVDGVIALNDQFVQALIETVGPVPILDGTVVNDKNVKEVTLDQIYREGHQDQAQFFKELGFTLITLAKRLPPKQLLQLGKLITAVVTHRDLMITSFDLTAAATLHDLGVDGALQGERDDYLYFVEHNVSYNKLSPFIRQDLTYEVELDADGRPNLATLIVDEANTYTPGAGLPGYPEGYYDGGRWNPMTYRVDRLEGYYGGYTRLYLPMGSRVLNVIGFDDTPEIGVESNRTVAGGYVGLLSNTQRQLQFKWVPGSRPGTPGQYRLLVQRQPGAPGHALSVVAHLPPGYRATEVTPPPIFMADDTVTWHTLLDQDQTFSLLLEADERVLAAIKAQESLTATLPITTAASYAEFGRARLPVWLNIPAIEVDAPIVAVGLEPSGIMASPAEADIVGWYELGPRPSEPSNAVLAGHVTWKGETGVFSRLHELKPGDTIEVKSGPEASYHYVVDSIETYQANNAPVAEIFGATLEPVLTLITCGGAYDTDRREYQDRIVVRARGAD